MQRQRYSRRTLFHILFGCLIIVGANPALPALSAPIYVFGNTSQYGFIDSDTGAYTSIGRLTDSFTGASIPLSGFAFGADSNLYGVTGIDGSGENGEGNYLWRFNPADGVSTDRRDLPVSLVTIARRYSDGRMFGYTNDAEGNGQLYSFGLQSFTPTLVGPTGVTTFGALTFDDADRLYLAHSFTGDIFRVDAETGQTTLFAATGIFGITGMAAVGETLFTFSTDGRARHAVNLRTGNTTLLGTYNIGGNAGDDLIYGAALAPSAVAVPEPATGLLGTLALLGTFAGSARRRSRNKK